MKKTIAITIILLMFSLALAGCSKPNLDNFAKCVSESGMTMYGTYWCPHCVNVKKSFGSSFQYINYVECDANGPKGDPNSCETAGVKGYPTFIFGDGMPLSGELTHQVFADKTGCELPE